MNGNLNLNLSIASLTAFLVKEKYAISFGLIPLSRYFSTLPKSLVVLPVPGGPNILIVLEWSFFIIPSRFKIYFLWFNIYFFG